MCLLLFLPVSGRAQLLKYSTDTLQIADSVLVIRRSSQQQLEEFKLLGSKAHGISMRLAKLQVQLDDIKEALLKNGEVYSYYTANAQSIYDDIRAFYPRYTLPEYEREIKFYQYIQAKQDAEEENVD